MNDEELFRRKRNSVDKTFKIEIEKGRPNNSDKTFYKIRSPLFNL